MMASKTAPVVVHRWFPDGEGWAHDPLLSADDILQIMQLFDRQLKGTDAEQFAAAAMGGWLIGERRSDHESRDSLAKHRSPTIFRVALLDRKPTEQEEACLRQQLGHILPAARGIQTLKIRFPLLKATNDQSLMLLRIGVTICVALILSLASFVWVIRGTQWWLPTARISPMPANNPAGATSRSPLTTSDAKTVVGEERAEVLEKRPGMNGNPATGPVVLQTTGPAEAKGNPSAAPTPSSLLPGRTRQAPAPPAFNSGQ